MNKPIDYSEYPGFGVPTADVAAYLAAADRRRAEAVRRALVGAARALRNAAKSVLGRFEARQARREALDSLLSMGERELRDIGLTRSTVLDQFKSTEAPGPAANQNTSQHAA